MQKTWMKLHVLTGKVKLFIFGFVKCWCWVAAQLSLYPLFLFQWGIINHLHALSVSNILSVHWQRVGRTQVSKDKTMSSPRSFLWACSRTHCTSMSTGTYPYISIIWHLLASPSPLNRHREQARANAQPAHASPPGCNTVYASAILATRNLS